MFVLVLVSKTDSMRSIPGSKHTTARIILVGGSPSFVVNLYQAWGGLLVSAADRVAYNLLNLAQPLLGLPAAMVCRILGMGAVTDTSVGKRDAGPFYHVLY